MLFRARSSATTDADLTPTPDLMMVEEPEPTEEPEYARADFTIKVLNGSGVAGLAGDLESSLNEAEFNVTETGNADNYDYTTTIIQSKADVPEAFIDELVDELSGTYDDVETESLDEEEDTDVVIIIGGAQAEEEEETTDEQTTEETTEEENTDTTEAEPTEEPTQTPTPTTAE